MSTTVEEKKTYVCHFIMEDGTECGQVCSGPQGLGSHQRSHGIKGKSKTATKAAKAATTETPEIDAEMLGILAPLEARMEMLLQERERAQEKLAVIDHSIAKVKRVLRVAAPEKYSEQAKTPPKQNQQRFSNETLAKALDVIQQMNGESFTTRTIEQKTGLASSTVSPLIVHMRETGLIRLTGTSGHEKVYVGASVNGH